MAATDWQSSGLGLGALVVAIACSSSSGSDDSDGGDASNDDIELQCETPARPTTSTTERVVGDGTASSCNEEALRSAIEGSAHVTFDCGGDATISVTEPLVLEDGTMLDGEGAITLDGGQQTRILEVEYYASVVIEGITFQNGAMLEVDEEEGLNDCGGAIYGRDRNTIFVEDCRFYDNYAAGTKGHGGGAIYPMLGTLTVVRSEFRGNHSTIGGAIHSMLNEFTLIDCDFEDNEADDSGGAVFTDGGSHKQVCGCSFTGNRAGSSAGAGFLFGYRHDDAANDTLLVDHCEFRDNAVTGTAEEASNQGGAVIIAADTQIRSSLFADNVARKGGAIVVWQGPIDIENSTFVGNEAPDEGGAVTGWGSDEDSASVVNCTFADNQSNYGGALSLTWYGAVDVRNSILARNGAEGNWTRNCSTELSGSNNLAYPAEGDDVCGAGFTIDDPLLESEFGTSDVALVFTAESPAQGAGADCPEEDQLGESRPEQGCDLGAVEVP